MAVKIDVTYLRSNEVNDIFKVIRRCTITGARTVSYKEYPRSMDMNPEQVKEEQED